MGISLIQWKQIIAAVRLDGFNPRDHYVVVRDCNRDLYLNLVNQDKTLDDWTPNAIRVLTRALLPLGTLNILADHPDIETLDRVIASPTESLWYPFEPNPGARIVFASLHCPDCIKSKAVPRSLKPA